MYIFSIRKDFHYLCHLSVEKWQTIQIYLYVSNNNYSLVRVGIPLIPEYINCNLASVHQEGTGLLLGGFLLQTWASCVTMYGL